MSIVFQHPYNRSEFLQFLRNDLLPEDFRQKSEAIEFHVQTKYINSFTEIGVSEQIGTHVFEVEHDSEHDPRVTLSREMFRIMRWQDIHRALAIFKSTTSGNYRFSLVTIDFELTPQGVEKTYSNPRRYSYFLGPDSKTHTPAQFLIQKGRVATFDDLRERFSVEVVNKEFYEEIAKLFTKLVGGERKIRSQKFEVSDSARWLYLPGSQDHEKLEEFAVRLIGRLVFCWFLKKKTSANGVSLIPDGVLSTDSITDNYYHKVIEPLFFQVLNTPIDARLEEFRTEIWALIPFLNGGLFEPHADDYYESDALGVSKHLNTLKIRDQWFRELLELFERYNFTIDENTSVDVDLSIDPEMLGRIFENLLAEINPETGETARKNTGSYYTPRPIVDYMVEESLRLYLEENTTLANDAIDQLLDLTTENVQLFGEQTEEVLFALHNLKALDPACGSGAFPMGMLQKILFVLQKVDPDSQKWLDLISARIPDPVYRRELQNRLNEGDRDYIRKLGILQNSIYGVDIQPVAVEISKLRGFLSLVVDETVEDDVVNRGVEALPNLEFKFVAANTLIGLDKPDVEGAIEHALEEQDVLKGIREKYLQAYGEGKEALETEFLETQRRMLTKAQTWGRKGQNSVSLQLSTWNPFNNESNDWFDPEWMFGVEGFDIVIGNPPYRQLQKDGGELGKLYKDQGYQTYTRTGDIYCLFYENGINLLKDRGILCLITSNKWMRAKYGKKTREFFINRTNPLEIIDFGGYKVFQSATVDTNILIAQRGEKRQRPIGCAVQDGFQPDTDLGKYVSDHQVPVNNLSSDIWVILAPVEQRIKENIEQTGTPLKEWDVNIYRGVLTGYNKAFIIDGETREQLIAEDSKSAEIIKPILRGRDIKRYTADFADKWLIATHNSYVKDNGESVPRVDVEKDYPAIKSHLDQYWDKLEQRYDQGDTPYNLRNCAYYEELEKEKIVYPDIMRLPRDSTDFLDYPYMYLDRDGYYVEATNFLITGENLIMVFAILTSQLGIYSFINYYSGPQFDNKGFRYKKVYLEKVPVPNISQQKQEPFKELVDQILSAKNKNLGADTATLEREIDRMVYDLYGLTGEEIGVVEGNTERKH